MHQEDTLEQRIKQLEELLEYKTEQLNEVTRELDDLSFAVSHDLKAPVRAIAGFSAILKDEQADSLNSEGKRVLGVIEKNSVKLTDMLNEIVNCSAISKKSVQPQKINMLALLQGALGSLLSAKEKDIFKITVDNIEPCIADENMMKQLWLNLCNMVLLYAEKNSFFNIFIESTLQQQQIIYNIKTYKISAGIDNLNGVAELAKAIATRETLEGSGTGTAFIKRVLYKHGGNFWIQSVPAHECSFNFSIPV